MPEKQTKKQRIDEARETARIAREKRERRQKTLRWLVPSSVTLAILLIGALVTTLVIVNQPAPTFPGGPKNMVSDGIVFTGDSGELAPTETAALKKGQAPKDPTWAADDARPHVVTYIDWACPVCQQFESVYGTAIETAVAADQMTLEVRPIAIVDRSYLSSRYASRVNNAAACIANYAPDSFYTVQSAIYKAQPAEGTNGLTNAQITKVVKDAGLDNSDVNSCISSERFKPWVKAATDRATADESIRNSAGQFGTPTIMIDDQRVEAADFGSFIDSLSGAGATG